MKRFLLVKDINGNVIYGLDFTGDNQSTTLSANVAQDFDVPANADIAFFSYSPGASVFVNPYDTATLPGSSVTSTDCILNPVVRNVTSGQTLSCISDGVAYVQITYFNLALGKNNL